jgi:KUP system potassium uptake protein
MNPMTEKLKLDKNLRLPIVATIGVVYGDIGTSPLYALKSCFLISALPVTAPNILGLISLFIWTLFLLVTIKYIFLVLKIDHEGEGGILILSSFCSKIKRLKYSYIPFFLGIVGASLLFADGIITPSISVLGALEGLELLFPEISNYISYLSIFLLTALFLFQYKGTSKIGGYFGPIMIVWFISLFILGAYHIVKTPYILNAINPLHAIKFIVINKLDSLKAMGGVVLVVTGAEALYSDLGHFGKNPIKISWLYLVFPALAANYLGQGSLLLTDPSSVSNPFYYMVPSELLYPLIFLSTIATIIASQSIITGIFSLTYQAIMFGYLPRMRVYFTSSGNKGQIYIPFINFVLYVFTALVTLAFKSTNQMVVVYGLSVIVLMAITTILMIYVAKLKWKWSLIRLLITFVPLLSFDFLFILTNLFKLFDGAFYILLISLFTTYLMWVWITGNSLKNKQIVSSRKSLKEFAKDYKDLPKIPGNAVFLSNNPEQVLDSLAIHLKYNKFLHQRLFFVSIAIETVPEIYAEKNKYIINRLEKNLHVMVVKYGFREIPNVTNIVEYIKDKYLKGEEEISIFLSKAVPVASSSDNTLNRFNELVYIFLHKNACDIYDFYKIPPEDVLELRVRYKV